MLVVKRVCAGNQLLVEAPLAHARLVAAHQQDCGPSGIKCESDSQDLVFRVGPKLLHISVFRPVESIGVRTTQTRPQSSEELHLGDDFDLPIFVQVDKPAIEFVRRRDFPRARNIDCRLWTVKQPRSVSGASES
jgi:hypothetical protein